MDLLTILFAILCSVLIYYFYNKKNIFELLDIPHDPPKPFFGSMAPGFFQKMSICQIVSNIYKSHPEAKYVGLYDFQTPVILIRDPEIIKSIAIKNFNIFCDKRGNTDEKRDPIFGKGLFSLKGEEWKKLRTLLSPCFTSSKMKTMFDLITECVVNFTDTLVKRNKENNQDLNIKDIFTRLAADIIAYCAFGIKIDSMNDPKNEFYVIGRKSTDLEGILSIKFLLIRNFSFISRLFGVKILSESVNRFFTEMVRSNVLIRKEKGITRQDFLQMFMKAKFKNDDNRNMTIREMTSSAFGFLFAGLDTVSSQLSYIFYVLAINSKVQQKLQKDIDTVFKKCNGQLTYEEINSMAYLEAVIYEVLRLYPGGVFVDRTCLSKFELPPPLPGKKSVTIEPGMSVWFPIFDVQRDPNYCENPEKFDPERFLRDNKTMLNTETFFPFGIGPRMCLGYRFAMLEMKVTLFHLLLRFNLKTCSKTPIPVKFKSFTATLAPEEAFWLRFEARE